MSIKQDKHKPRENNKTPAPNSIHPSLSPRLQEKPQNQKSLIHQRELLVKS